MTCYDKFLEKLKTIQYLKSLQKLRNQHGAVFALTALLLPVLFGFMGLGYDVGNLYLHKARLQDTADATALAGARGYVNELKGSSTGVISLPSSTTQTKKNDAIAALKTNADNYIANNNPVFKDKLNHDNRTEKLYYIGNEVTSPVNNKSIEYFRVVLSEPVQLYFLPVIGIKNSANVSVYATTKLSDNEIVEVSNGGSNPVDAEYKPVVIGTEYFYDLKTYRIGPPVAGEDASKTSERNSYNSSNVYVASNGKIDGSTVLYSSEGADGTFLSNPEDKLPVDIQKKDYNLETFGLEIRKLFLQKYINENFTGTEKLNKEAKVTEFLTDLQSWKQQRESIRSAYMLSSGLGRAVAIYDQVSPYAAMLKNEFESSGQNLQYAKEKVIAAWSTETDKTITDEEFNSLLNDLGNNIWNIDQLFYAPNTDNWMTGAWDDAYNKYKRFSGIPSVKGDSFSEYLSKQNLGLEPRATDAKYGLEYYMTYRGTNGQHYYTNAMSNDGNYCYIAHSNFTDAGATSNMNIYLNGFKQDPPSEDTPFYLLLEDDIGTVNVYVNENCNRPIIFCYFGTEKVHFAKNDTGKNQIKGIFYMPDTHQDTFANWEYVNFTGSVIARRWHFQNGHNSFKYDPNEIKKWTDLKDDNGQKSDDALPVTPNTGFADSNSSGGNTGGSSVETENITIPDHLRLVLASSITDDSHYNQARVSWHLIE